MKCPFCGHPDSKVIDSRESKKGISIRRRRACISCHKRFTTYEKIEEIESKVQERPEKEIASSEIGQLVMEKLRALDKVAYVRFASVYRDFKDVLEFKQEAETLLKEK